MKVLMLLFIFVVAQACCFFVVWFFRPTSGRLSWTDTKFAFNLGCFYTVVWVALDLLQGVGVGAP